MHHLQGVRVDTSMSQGSEYRNQEFPRYLRHWRTVRGLSQAKLAEKAGVSVKHYNFLENGRSKPSKSVVITLGHCLGLSLKFSNSLLIAAGFAPRYRKSELSSEDMAYVKSVLDRILAKQEPFPGIVMSPTGNLIQNNIAALKVFSHFVSVETMLEFPNIYELFFADRGFKPYIRNWDDLARHILSFVKQEVFELEAGNDAYRLLKRLEQSANFESDWQNRLEKHDDKPIFQIKLQKDGLELAFISTYTSFGNPFDVSLQELRIECFYPADEKTEQFCQKLSM